MAVLLVLGVVASRRLSLASGASMQVEAEQVAPQGKAKQYPRNQVALQPDLCLCARVSIIIRTLGELH